MRIMSFNTLFCTNYFTKRIDFVAIADAIKKCNPDIVGLNEMYEKSHMAEYDSQTQKLSVLSGLPYFRFAEACTLEEGTFGNGFLSRMPFVSAEVIPVPEDEIKTGDQLYEPRCLLKVKYADGLTVLVIHFGLNKDEHMHAVNTVLRNLEKEKCVLMGDFNVTPDNEVLKPIQERLTDTSDYLKVPLKTFPSDKPFKKIDYIFVSRDIKVTLADIPNVAVSDHLPCIADIEI